MKQIQMVDLVGQYSAIQEELDAAMLNVVRSGKYINGDEVGRLAEGLSQFTGSRYVIPCGNGTDALQIALMALNLNPGDEVIVPAFTYAAAAEAVVLLGLVPVVTDVEPDTFNLDIAKLGEALSPKTKAIVPVHLFGQTTDMSPILSIANNRGIRIVEDNAQSIGSSYIFPDGKRRQAGTMGDIGTLSFFPTKNLGCYGDGGAILTDNEELAFKLQIIGKHGQSKKYHHLLIGCNSRLDTLQAAILFVKLKYLNEFTAIRQEAADYYRKKLSGLIGKIALPQEKTYSSHVYNQFTIQVNEGKRDALQQFLKEKKIPSTVYYPLPLHKQEAFRTIVKQGSNLSESERLCDSVLSLPMHTELEKDQQDYIAHAIIDFFN